jgi:hypothetical protein
VQAVIELALECPLELRMVKIARMKFEIIGVNFNGRVFEIDDYFYAISLLASVKREEWVLVKSELFAYTLQSGRKCGHQRIVKQGPVVTERTVDAYSHHS